MIGFIKDWAVNIVTLVLLITMMEMLLPKGKIKKYINLMTGTILIIAIVEPVIGLFGKGFDFTASQAASAMNLDRREIEKISSMIEEEQVKQTVVLYRNRLIDQIERQVQEVDGVIDAKADIIINEDYNSESFGKIKRIYIQVYTRNDGKGGQNEPGASGTVSDDGSLVPNEDGGPSDAIDIPVVDKIEKIRVWNKRSHTSEDKAGMDDADFSVLKSRLADRVEDVFGVSRDNIIISHLQR